MKKHLFLSSFYFCLLSFSPAQQYTWNDISNTLPSFPYDTVIINGGADTLLANLTDISFISNNEGWITTSHTFEDQESAILHTANGGQSWEVQTVLHPCQFIHMVNENIGYAASGDGKIFKTMNGGEEWSYHAITGTSITGMSFPPGRDTGYVCSYSASKMHRITPVGIQVINFDNAPFWWNSISAPSHELIWLSATGSVYTYDQDGLTDQPVTSDNYYSIDFLRDNLGWGCGSHGVKQLNEGTIMGCLGKDIPWVVLAYTSGPLYEIFALDESHVWAVGSIGQIWSSSNASDFGFNQQTSTGWTNVTFSKAVQPRPEATLRSVFFTSIESGYASANGNILLKYGPSNSAGESCKAEFLVSPNPSKGKFVLKNPKPLSQKFSIQIIDAKSRTIMEINDASETMCEIKFDMTGHPSGIYYLRIRGEKAINTLKIILQE